MRRGCSRSAGVIYTCCIFSIAGSVEPAGFFGRRGHFLLDEDMLLGG